MCGGDAPAAPDPVATAQAQIGVNNQSIKDTTKFNQINQNNPFGSLSYSGSYDDPNDPRTQNVTLTPELMKILQGQTGITQGLTDAAQSRLSGIPQGNYAPPTDPNAFGDKTWNTTLEGGDKSWNTEQQRSVDQGNILNSFDTGTGATQNIQDVGGPQRSLTNQNFAQQIKDAGDAVYGAQTQYVDADYGRQDQKLEATLAAKGIPEGSQAWNDAKAQEQQSKQQTLQGARNAATTQGFNVQQGLFGEQLQGAQFGNNAQAQAYGQAANDASFYNQGAGQNYAQNQGAADFSNQAQNQDFTQDMANAQLNNQALSQNFAQGMDLTNLHNSALSTNFNQGMAVNQYNQGEYQRQQANNIQNRQQSFNELAAMLNGSPISPTNPTFQPTTQYQAATAAPNSVGTANNNYSSAQQARAAIMGSIFGAAGNVGAAFAGCWVAREVLGVGTTDWVDFRKWLFNKAPKWFKALYLKHGERFALWIADKPRLKSIIRKWMEARIGH